MVIGDLLGPAGGESEELTERSVRDRYLVGVLAPSRGHETEEHEAVPTMNRINANSLPLHDEAAGCFCLRRSFCTAFTNFVWYSARLLFPQVTSSMIHQ